MDLKSKPILKSYVLKLFLSYSKKTNENHLSQKIVCRQMKQWELFVYSIFKQSFIIYKYEIYGF